MSVPFARDVPYLLYSTGTTQWDLRVVLRAVDRWPEGYVEIEQLHWDALGVASWIHVDSFSLTAELPAKETHLRVLQHYLRTLVPMTLKRPEKLT